MTRHRGPDGYSSRFFKAAWPVVGEEVTRAVLRLLFYRKTSEAGQLHDLGPDPKDITRCAYPRDAALKVDIRKAYDTVEWDFLLAVFAACSGFHLRLQGGLRECVTTTSFSIGLNGKPHGFFAGARGLRQGDPLSPYLFVLVMEALHLGFLQRIETGHAIHLSLEVEIEKRLRTFLWKGTTSSGYAKVAWKDVCRPMDEGGLGFKDISTLNRALMSKKLCDVIQCDRTSIWVQWLYQDRLRERSIWTIREHGGSWGWRKILRLRPFLRTIVDYQIGNGDRFFVWQDPWHHLGPLIERFPQGPRHLRLEESAKLSLVISAGEWQWPTITDFECLEITHNLPLILGGEDRVVWRCDEGQPTTQALYRLFTHPEPKVGWSSLLLGSLKIPRHSFILWLAILGKLLTCVVIITLSKCITQMLGSRSTFGSRIDRIVRTFKFSCFGQFY
ncbi:UNVERIFIED_CONTAM: hypothetical protein Sindi_2003100 [Sesamum indicum]